MSPTARSSVAISSLRVRFGFERNRSGTQGPMANGRSSAVRARRVYESREPNDGRRVLVDRIWPRGLTKASADLDEWCKEVAPSTQLRKWYAHDPDWFEEFERRYKLELTESTRTAAFAHLRELRGKQPLTLLTATKRVEISAAAVLAALLGE